MKKENEKKMKTKYFFNCCFQKDGVLCKIKQSVNFLLIPLKEESFLEEIYFHHIADLYPNH